MAVILLISIVVLAALAAAVSWLIFTFSKYAVAFSKVTFSLAVAFLLHTNHPLVENGWVSFLIYGAITLACCFVLCLSPRFNCAFQFFCSALVTFLVTEIVGGGFLALVMGLIGPGYEPNLLTEIIVKVICIGVSVPELLYAIETTEDFELFANPILVNLERGIASIVYGITLYIICAISMNDILGIPLFVEWIVLIGGAIVAFIIDLCLTHKNNTRG